ncbi:MAG: glycosyltransferase family 39 protein [Patescibacteria group bacterium]
MITKKYRLHLYLGLILLLALLVRIVGLGSLPHNFHEDEVLVGYVGRYIIQNGIDIYGKSWPLWFFNKFGDFYIIGPFYLSGISTLFFGVNEFAVRFPTAFLGALTILPIFGIALKLTNNTKAALYSSLVLAIMPWHVVLSRTSTEGVMGSFFFITAIYFLYEYIESRKILHYILSSMFLLIGYFVYHPFRIYPPILLILSMIIFWQRVTVKQRIFLTGSLALFSFLTLYILSTNWGSGRLNQTSIFNDVSRVKPKSQELIYASKIKNTSVNRVIHNKYLGFGREYLRQYLSYLNPDFLFFDKGWSDKYVVPNVGLLFFGFGVGILFFIYKLRKFLLIGDTYLKLSYFSILLLSLVPAAVTYIGSPNINRSTIFGVLLAIPIAIGLTSIKNKYLILFVSFLIGVEFALFGLIYISSFDAQNALTRQDASKELVQYVLANRTKRFFVPTDGSLSVYFPFMPRIFKSLSKEYTFGAKTL